MSRTPRQNRLNPIPAAPATHPRTIALVIITPVRDEAKYLRLTMDAMVAQTMRPVEWIVVDDGSTDATPDIVREYAQQYPFIRLVLRQDRGFRKLGGGVVAAFNFGTEHIEHQDYRYIAKLDGDMSFGPLYIEHMLRKLDEDPKLATVSGQVYRDEGGRFIEEIQVTEQVAGQFKLYRREAFEDIGGFVEHLAWDGIDIHTAWMKGWKTFNYYDPDAWLWHHRIMGSSDKHIYEGRLRWGRGNWYMGYHPLYAVVAGLNRMREKPYVIGGLLMIYSYFLSALRGLPRYEHPEFRRYLRNWQMQRLKRFFSGRK
ncbi:glycosyltransferase family A protein [Herbaspirillum sp. RTI4]|uniref:glycosyltransferase n=1 Tax=Herbaspirillum sp. RTI4 TaxID=3048640 RepID=UPI002AB50ECA|nr:glycosyltransferase family A protein [Herbaspirillum sp. RTI4]MDY7578253.1 glycosyltransferase family A protein [Herbaspirillum sp. RTI4]MEA9983474.1 glycosyltransferase family A protein [Herbaspirillum sp. RTI4]